MAQTLQPGTPLQGGKYVIKQVLGQGGFGITYLAEQVSLGRDVAIKEFFMRDNCLRDGQTSAMTVPTTGSAAQVAQFRKKFHKEARTLAGLDHPHIIGVIDVFEENKTVYYSMPYMPGGSLKALVEREGVLDMDSAMRYIRQISSALQYMHDKCHICHYDIKPDNILLDRNGNAVLIDFGISKNYDAQGNATSTTPIGLSQGFAPVEQYQGIEGYSPASDVYALGATLYYLLEGQRPPTAVSRVSGTRMDYPVPVPQPGRALIERAMTISIADRPSSVAMFLADPKAPLDEQTEPRPEMALLVDEETVPLQPVPEKTKPKGEKTKPAREKPKSAREKQVETVIDPKPKSNLKVMLLSACAGLVLIGGGYAIYHSSNNHPDEPVAAFETEATESPSTSELKVTSMHVESSNGSYTYTGEINEDNLPDGKGSAFFDNGDKCEGTFETGKISGDNIRYTYANGDTFVGSFKNDEPYEGRFTLAADGSYTRGLFSDINAGKTTWYDKNGNKL